VLNKLIQKNSLMSDVDMYVENFCHLKSAPRVRHLQLVMYVTANLYQWTWVQKWGIATWMSGAVILWESEWF